MMEANSITLAAAILAFAASVIATVAAAYNGRFGRYAKERWWARKVHAYTRILEALSDLVYYYEEQQYIAFGMHVVSEERKKQIEGHWQRGYVELKRATAVGSFLMSGKAKSVLEAMWKNQDKGVDPQDWQGILDSRYTAARECLESLVLEAKSDLGTK